MDSRFDRNIRFFGAEGQAGLRNAKVTIIGAGGVGSHVLQQLAFLGVGSICVVDAEQLADTNRNRYVTCQFSDPVPGSPKVEIAERLIRHWPVLPRGISREDPRFACERNGV